jgi:stage II sporulation protein D
MTRRTKRAVFAAIILIMILRSGSAAADTAPRVLMDGKIIQMEREEYLVGVVAAEMPALYHIEALKAQAVAAHTRVVSGRCRQNMDANVCADSACCQGYIDELERLAKWGADADKMNERVHEAVAATEGLIMFYDGEPIEVLYHAISGGYTADVEDVYANALPYLRGVASPGEEQARGYQTEQVFTKKEIAEAFPDAIENGKIVLEILERSQSGRVTLIRVGRLTMTGRMFRSALGLRSTNFELSAREDQIVIAQTGYGHGVGMSQAGANAMANDGADYMTILSHYYTGITFGRIDPK